MEKTVVTPGGTIGILGAGQLGRMLALAAARYGLRTHVFCPDADGPAFDLATFRTIAAYEDEDALAAFAAGIDVVTYEFENVPLRTAQFLAQRIPLRPGEKILSVSQDRLVEKNFIAKLGLPTAPFASVDGLSGLHKALRTLGVPAILKTRQLGYDGKGQVMIRAAHEAEAAWKAIGEQAAILEGFVIFETEISVVAARGLDGSFEAFEVCENAHEDHILRTTHVPARIDNATRHAALSASRSLLTALDVVGVATVELFVLKGEDGSSIVVNELAPRVHNSGHWTIEGAATSQFDQHIRAICGWPLGNATSLGAATMTNLIGADGEDWQALLEDATAHLHLYGKREARPGRKMGHVTRLHTL